MSATVIRLANLTENESALLRELVRLRAEVRALECDLATERARRSSIADELHGLRMLRKDVLDAAIAVGFGAEPE